MSSYASISTLEHPLSYPAASIGVFRYRPGSQSPYDFLPNIRVLEIVHREGPEPGLAKFRYIFDSNGPASDPWQFQQVLSVDASLPGVVQNDERIVVLNLGDVGISQVLFDGFAQVPELGYGPNRETVEFVAYGTSVRAWDRPIGGCLMRDAGNPQSGRDVLTDLITRFNPNNQPNATPTGADRIDGFGNVYPIFLDPLSYGQTEVHRQWNLSMAIKYLLFTNNQDETFVRNPDPDLLDVLLQSSIDATTSSDELIVPDFWATGKPWPIAIYGLLKPNGFGMGFVLETSGNGEPVTRLKIFRVQGFSEGIDKELFLQSYGEELDSTQTNMGQARLARDTSRIANSYVVDTALTRYEASFILAPGFRISETDSLSISSIDAFSLSSTADSTENLGKYRLFIFDEIGDGHWNRNSAELQFSATSLREVLDSDNDRPSTYVERRRIPLPNLLTNDSDHRNVKAQLSISTDYAGLEPGLWNGTGNWQIVSGGWELLTDRLGVYVNVSNPNGWNIGPSREQSAPFPTGVVRVVEALSRPDRTPFRLRLTCVIEGDRMLDVTAERRDSSPTKYNIQSRIEARARYLKEVKVGKSEFNPGSNPVIVRDDTDEAKKEAEARRLTTESGVVAGTVTIPRFTMSYEIGDRISAIRGRNLSLRTNAGATSVEREVFPTIISRTWNFDQRQRTLLQLSDQRVHSL
jgi:hypothetical protein